MLTNNKSRRYEERLETLGRVTVRCRESHAVEWEENTHLLDVSRLGARIAMDTSIESGRIVHLSMSIPEHLRSYILASGKYEMWAVVRAVMEVNREEEPEALRYKVGVAFIGKNPPDDYTKDPSQLYDLKPVPRRAGLWEARKRPRQ